MFTPPRRRDLYSVFLSVPLWLGFVLCFCLFILAFVREELLGWIGVICCLLQLEHCRSIYPPAKGDYDPLIMGIGRAVGLAAAASGFFSSEYIYHSAGGFMIVGVSYLWWLKFHKDMPEFRKVLVRFMSWTMILIGIMYFSDWVW